MPSNQTWIWVPSNFFGISLLCLHTWMIIVPSEQYPRWQLKAPSVTKVLKRGLRERERGHRSKRYANPTLNKFCRKMHRCELQKIVKLITFWCGLWLSPIRKSFYVYALAVWCHGQGKDKWGEKIVEKETKCLASSNNIKKNGKKLV